MAKTKSYKIDDLIIPMLKFGNSCPIKIEIEDRWVRLQIGPRDFEWNRKTGDLVHTGTMLD